MKSPELVIIDYGMGNLSSVRNALEQLKIAAIVTNDIAQIKAAEALILPGVGAFGKAMENLQRLGLVSVIQEKATQSKTPLLGICLGMQLLAETSLEHGRHQGLGLIPGTVKLLEPADKKLQVPHVGWNDVHSAKHSSLYGRISGNANFYFDHSYHFTTAPEFISATVDYGSQLVASVERTNVFGVQFHPEKSQNAGLRLLKGFTNYVKEGRC